MEINKNYEGLDIFSNRKEKNIIRFRDTVWSILNSKDKYRSLKDSLKIMTISDTNMTM